MDDRFLGLTWYNDEVVKLIFRFVIHFIFTGALIRGIYYQRSKNKEYFFTYFLISIVVFFLCFTLKKNELELGLALGLFAIFGIIRYRTNPIPIKEMTYLFLVIGIAVINALSNDQTSYVELLFSNIVLIAVAFGLESMWLKNHLKEKIVIYDKINLTHKDFEEHLIEDLRERTGLQIQKIEIEELDYLKDVARIKIFYEEY